VVIPAISPMHRRTQALWMVLVGVSAAVIAAEIPGDKELIRFEAKFGTVSFSHKAHSEQEGVQCSTCHHTHTEDSETISACHDCHIAVHYRVAQIACWCQGGGRFSLTMPRLPSKTERRG
jgi:uncharacterized paraquat-inducible protein A